MSLKQLNRRTRKHRKIKSPALRGAPQKRGLLTSLHLLKPKKPNSAQRKACKVRLRHGEIFCYIPGLGHTLQKHSDVLVRGGRVPDLPGMKYKLIRSKLDFDMSENFNRKARRSKFSVINSERKKNE